MPLEGMPDQLTETMPRAPRHRGALDWYAPATLPWQLDQGLPPGTMLLTETMPRAPRHRGALDWYAPATLPWQLDQALPPGTVLLSHPPLRPMAPARHMLWEVQLGRAMGADVVSERPHTWDLLISQPGVPAPLSPELSWLVPQRVPNFDIDVRVPGQDTLLWQPRLTPVRAWMLTWIGLGPGPDLLITERVPGAILDMPPHRYQPTPPLTWLENRHTPDLLITEQVPGAILISMPALRRLSPGVERWVPPRPPATLPSTYRSIIARQDLFLSRGVFGQEPSTRLDGQALEEKAGQTLIAGAIVLVDVNGFIFEGGANPDAIVGVALEAGHNTATDGERTLLVRVATPQMFWEASIGNSANPNNEALVLLDRFTRYGVTKDTTTGAWFVDKSKTLSADQRVTILRLIDPIGTIRGLVLMRFRAAHLKLFS